MTCRPFASVTACTWSAPGTCAVAAVKDIVAASSAPVSNPRDIRHLLQMKGFGKGADDRGKKKRRQQGRMLAASNPNLRSLLQANGWDRRPHALVGRARGSNPRFSALRRAEVQRLCQPVKPMTISDLR